MRLRKNRGILINYMNSHCLNFISSKLYLKKNEIELRKKSSSFVTFIIIISLFQKSLL